MYHGSAKFINVPALQQAQAVLTSLYTARLTLAASPYAEVNIDGQTVRFAEGGKLDEQIYFWEKKVALLSGRRRRASTISMDGLRYY